MGVPDPREGEIGESKPQPKHAIANCNQTISPTLSPGEYKRGVSDSNFCQITLVLVIITELENILRHIADLARVGADAERAAESVPSKAAD